MIALSTIPAYLWGVPWFTYHQENLVVYDCQIKTESVPIGAKYPGRIAEVLVEVGQRVSANQVIVRMDTSELTAQTKRAQATIELAKANWIVESESIKKAIATLKTQQRCAETKTTVAQQRATALKIETEILEKDVLRSQKLVRSHSLARSKFEKIQREFQRLKNQASIATAEVKVVSLDKDVLQSEMEELRAKLHRLVGLQKKIEMAQAELEAIEERRAAATVRAAEPGTVTHVFRGTGSSIKLGDPIIEIHPDTVWSEIWIDESDLALAKPGTEVKITLRAYPNTPLEGQIAGFLPSHAIGDRLPLETNNPVLQPETKICVQVQLSSQQVELIPGLRGVAVIEKHRDGQDEAEQPTP